MRIIFKGKYIVNEHTRTLVFFPFLGQFTVERDKKTWKMGLGG